MNNLNMKRILLFFLVAFALVSCSSPKKAEPVIREYLMGNISNPDSYTAGETTVVAKGVIDANKTMHWENISDGDKIDVTLLRHEFTYRDRTDTVTDAAFYFYMDPALKVIYYVHRDLGSGPLFEIESAK